MTTASEKLQQELQRKSQVEANIAALRPYIRENYEAHRAHQQTVGLGWVVYFLTMLGMMGLMILACMAMARVFF